MVIFQVTREGGSIGEVKLNWKIENDPNNDILHKSGSVDFAQGQLSAELEIQIRGDTVPELDEVFIVQIENVSLVKTIIPLKFYCSGVI